MKGQIPFFDIGVIAVALIIFVIISIFLPENLHLYDTIILINIIYDTNEAYRLLVSLLSLNYSSYSTYEMISTYGYYPEECPIGTKCVDVSLCRQSNGECVDSCSFGCCCRWPDSTQSSDFCLFLNASLYRYLETIPKCYKLTFGSKVIVEFKDEGYSEECSNTRFNAALPIFLPYNKGRLVEFLYLNYER